LKVLALELLVLLVWVVAIAIGSLGVVWVVSAL